jgi:hypothetical protein
MTKAFLFVFAIVMGLVASGSAGAVICTVPATATGSFGNPNTTGSTPLVPCITISERGTIVIRASGTWSYAAGESNTANGTCYPGAPFTSGQIPLQEAAGVGGGVQSCTIGALIGAFVPRSTANNLDFKPVDGTKNLVAVGINPNMLFFVGVYGAFEANGPGTLYLGMNDGYAADNSGSLSVSAALNYVPPL